MEKKETPGSQEKKRKLLERMLLKEGLSLPGVKQRISRRPDETRAPLSYAQERLWYIDRIAPDSRAYNIPFAARMQGNLDTGAFRSVFQAIVDRHEVFRSQVAYDGRRPYQEILPGLRVDVPLVDLSRLVSKQREEALQEAIRAAARVRIPFDSAPLFRTRLVRLSANLHVWLFTVHHIIADGWTLALILNEFSALYKAELNLEPPLLPDLEVQYADFAYWQRQRIAGGDFDPQLDFWKERLAGELPAVPLPLDHPRPDVQSFAGQWINARLPAGAASSLRALATAEGATLLTTLMAAFKVLLYRYTSHPDLLIGLSVANRPGLSLEGVAGHFVNVQSIRTQLDRDLSYRDLVRRMQESLLDVYSNQDVPFELIIDEMGIERDASRNPIFQIVFIHQEGPKQGGWRSALHLPGIAVTQLETHSGTSKFDLSVQIEPDGEGLLVSMEFSTALFERETIERFLRHYIALIGSVLADPDGPIGQLNYLSPEESRTLESWSGKTSRYPRDSAIPQLFEEVARRSPDRTALTCLGESLSYAELDERANQVAHHLLRRGIRLETAVGIMAERSLETIVAILGILKAGGAYVPLDPAYPVERLQFMIEDSGIPVILAGRALTERLLFDGSVIPLDDAGVFRDEPTTAPEIRVHPENLAYIIYTSGSTGIPKGAEIVHRGVVRLVRETDFNPFSPDEVFLQFSPLSFDASTLEIWGPLLNGGRLAIAPAGKLSLMELGDVIRNEKVTTAWLTAGLFHLMVEQNPDGLSTLSNLLTGGDVVSPDHVRRILPRMAGGKITNGYGPTENTTFTTTYPVCSLEDVLQPLPIGSPVPNTSVFVLDDAMQRVPTGIAGKLYAGGDGLGRGYLKRPGLTAASWVPNPYGPPGSRLYATGDLARWHANGTLEFLGREDSQVKVRGFRIEPGEVEAVLGAHPEVRKAAVVTRKDESGEKRLVAYLVLEDGASQTPDSLRLFLTDRLPEYLIPSAFVLMDEFPLTDNGKLDRNALPAPASTRPALGTDFTSPQRKTEQVLAAIWQDVLGLEKVGVTDNFFDLGGNSLLIMQAHSRIEQELSTDLPVIQLFMYPTIRELANALES